MSRAPGSAAVRRRYVALTALRWLPTGMTAPVMVLLAAERGLSTGEIGLVVAAHSAVVVLLELPTGGLADALGHRPVIVLSILLGGSGLLAMVAADDVVGFALAYVLIGAGRALDSGPLESWFVDATRAADPGADLTPGLSRAAAADGAGLAVGAIVGGLAPGLASGAGGEVLALPYLLAVAVDAGYLAAVLLLVTPVGRPSTSSRRALLAGCRDVPRVVRATARSVRTDGVLGRLLLVACLSGVVLATLELLGPLRFADLAGDATGGSAVFGVVMAASFGAAALGSVLAAPARRAARGSTGAAVCGLAVLGAVAVGAIAVGTGTVAVAVAYAVFYLVHASGGPLRQQLLHERVPTEQRSTTLSASSLALQLGGVAGSLLVPRLAEATSVPAGFGVAAGALLLIAAAGLRLPTPAAPAPVAAGQPG